VKKGPSYFRVLPAKRGKETGKKTEICKQRIWQTRVFGKVFGAGVKGVDYNFSDVEYKCWGKKKLSKSRATNLLGMPND